MSGLTWDAAEPMDKILRRATKERLISPSEMGRSIVLDRTGVERLIPHRDPFLLVDQVTLVDFERGLIAARYSLERAAPVFAGHFPDRPIWPGVLQVEAMAQAGLVLGILQAQKAAHTEAAEPILTHILGALFVRPITPGGTVEIAARVMEDGYFSIVVGQCLYRDEICSVAAVQVSF